MDLPLLLILVVESLGVGWLSPTLGLGIGMTVDVDAIRVGEVGIAVADLHASIWGCNLT